MLQNLTEVSALPVMCCVVYLSKTPPVLPTVAKESTLSRPANFTVTHKDTDDLWHTSRNLSKNSWTQFLMLLFVHSALDAQSRFYIFAVVFGLVYK